MNRSTASDLRSTPSRYSADILMLLDIDTTSLVAILVLIAITESALAEEVLHATET